LFSNVTFESRVKDQNEICIYYKITSKIQTDGRFACDDRCKTVVRNTLNIFTFILHFLQILRKGIKESRKGN